MKDRNFDAEIKKRKAHDDDIFFGAFFELSSAVMGKTEAAARLKQNKDETQSAIAEIFAYYKLPAPSVDGDGSLEAYLRGSGLMHRTVKLKSGWYTHAIGPLLCTDESGAPVALIPKNAHYEWFDRASGRFVRVSKQSAKRLGDTATVFYEPLPCRAMTVKDLLSFMLKQLKAADWLLVVIAAALTSLMGLIVPYLNQYLFGVVIPEDNISFLWPVACLLFGTIFASVILNINKRLAVERIRTKISIALSAAAMYRVLSMPAAFFRKYSAGELSQRMSRLNEFAGTVIELIALGGLSALLSIMYFFQIFAFAPPLALPAGITLIATLTVTLIAGIYQQRLSKALYKVNARLSGVVYDVIRGVAKIKTAGAEKRAFGHWASTYGASASLSYNPPLLIKLQSVLPTVIFSFGLVLIYFCASAAKVSTADFMAFSSAYGMVSAAVALFAKMGAQIASLKPALDMASPILFAVPENTGGKQEAGRLSGSVEARELSFGYDKDAPMVLNNISVSIKSGEYVAIVGATGCGKSTLVRLLLGFEKPTLGAVYYDGKSADSIDLSSLRRRIGTVMQNGRLIPGSIYANIVLSAPWLTEDDAWRAAETAGIAEDIANMPMGMNTVVAEGSGGISGGQAQRILIARAIAPKPDILIFDEATSALDNTTQKQVSDALSALKCTRIVIAHRLSTVRGCDRILVMDGGSIKEEGGYDELIEKGGLFYELVKRQRI